jgi:hypothetical protein
MRPGVRYLDRGLGRCIYPNSGYRRTSDFRVEIHKRPCPPGTEMGQGYIRGIHLGARISI